MNMTNKKLAAAAFGILGAVWCICIIIISLNHNFGLKFGGSLLFGLIAVVLTEVYVLSYWNVSANSATEVMAVPVYYTFIYFAVGLLSNTVFLFTGFGGFSTLLIVFNIVVTAVYVILVLFSKTYTHRVSQQLENCGQKLENASIISEKLGILLNIAEDDELRKRIRSLKESVDYSSNVSTYKTYESEKIMEECLDELKDLIVNRDSRTLITNKMREAEITWKTRTGTNSAIG